MSLERLQLFLDDQKSQETLILNDKLLDEECCKLVSEYLRDYTHYTEIQLKGCNIFPSGFARLSEGLKHNLRLNSLILEWNQIGTDRKGLEALKKFIGGKLGYKSCRFKNNYVNAEGAEVIAAIIGMNGNLSSLDLKFNEIKMKGGEIILDMLQTNKNITFLDLSCNKIPEEVLQEVSRIMARNKKGGAVDFSKKQQLQQTQYVQQSMLDETVPQQQGQLNQDQYNTTVGKKNKADRVDEILRIERGRIKEMQEKMEYELEEERRLRETLETQFEKLHVQVTDKDNQIAEMEITYKNLLSENQLYRIDIEAIKRDITEMNRQSDMYVEQLQQSIKEQQEEICQLEREHNHEVDNINGDHEEYIRNMLNDFQIRYNALDDRYRQLKLDHENDEDKINLINENMLRFEMDHEEKMDILSKRLLDEECSKFDDQLEKMEKQLQEVKDRREQTIRKNAELAKEIDFREEKIMDQICDKYNNGYQIEINEVREKINKLHNEISLANLQIDQFKYQHIQSDARIDFLEEELAERNRDLIRIKEHSRQQVDYSIAVHNSERRVHKDNMEQLHARVCELDSSVRDQNAENEKMKTNYDRLCNLIQHNIGRTLNETLAVHTDIMRKKSIPLEKREPVIIQQGPPVQQIQQSVRRVPSPPPPHIVQQQHPVIIQAQPQPQPQVIQQPLLQPMRRSPSPVQRVPVMVASPRQSQYVGSGQKIVQQQPQIVQNMSPVPMPVQQQQFFGQQ